MGRSGDNGEEQKEIRRTVTTEIKTNSVLEDKEVVLDNKNLLPMGMQKSQEGTAKDEIKRSKTFESKSKLDILKKNVEMIPHYVPLQKAGKKQAAKPLSPKQQKALQDQKLRHEVADAILNMHTTLETEEEKTFGKKGIKDVNRTRYASLSERDKKKRVDAAIKRKANAAKLSEVE